MFVWTKSVKISDFSLHDYHGQKKIIKQIVPVLDSDWFKAVVNYSTKHTHLFTSVCCSATTLLQPQLFLGAFEALLCEALTSLRIICFQPVAQSTYKTAKVTWFQLIRFLYITTVSKWADLCKPMNHCIS